MKGAPVPHRRDASSKVLHWPKLFDGQVCPRGKPTINGDGYGYGIGYGYGYRNGNGYGNGSKNDTKGGGGYALTNGNGWSRRSV